MDIERQFRKSLEVHAQQQSFFKSFFGKALIIFAVGALLALGVWALIAFGVFSIATASTLSNWTIPLAIAFVCFFILPKTTLLAVAVVAGVLFFTAPGAQYYNCMATTEGGAIICAKQYQAQLLNNTAPVTPNAANTKPVQ